MTNLHQDIDFCRSELWAVRLTKPPHQTSIKKKTCNNCVSSDPTLSIIHGAALDSKSRCSETESEVCGGQQYSLHSADMIPSEWVQFNNIIFARYYIISIQTPPLTLQYLAQTYISGYPPSNECYKMFSNLKMK